MKIINQTTDELEQVSAEVRLRFGLLNPEQLNFKPAFGQILVFI